MLNSIDVSYLLSLPRLKTETGDRCDIGIRINFILTVISMLIAQGSPSFLDLHSISAHKPKAVLVLRIWFLYPHSKFARLSAVVILFVCTVGEAVTLGMSFKGLRSEILPLPGIRLLSLGCVAPPPSNLWRIFVPSFILHTILYIFTAYRGLHRRSIVAEAAPVVQRLLREYV